MEGTGQNFVSQHLNATNLYKNWGTNMFRGDAMSVDAESTAHAGEYAFMHAVPSLLQQNRNHGTVAEKNDFTLDEFGITLEEILLQDDQADQPLLDDESSSIHCSNAQQQDGRDDDFAAELEGILLADDLPVIAPVFANNHAVTRDTDLVQSTSRDEAVSTNAMSGVLWPVVPAAERIGVTYHSKNKQWEAHLWVKDLQLRKRKKKGKQVFLGNYSTADEAKRAHDRAAIKLNVRMTARGKAYPLNFPESAHARYMAEHSSWSGRDFLWKLRRLSSKFNKGKSSMKGVSVRKSAGRRRGKNSTAAVVLYEAKISRTMSDGGKRTFDLGKFESEEEAGKAYDRALLFLKGADELSCITNFRPSSYSAAEIEEAGAMLTTS